MREILCSKKILHLPDHKKLYVLTTDLSVKGMGAVLLELDDARVEYPVAYASRSCNAVEQNHSSFDGECLVVVWSTTHFRQYLFGNNFKLVTDHEPLKWIMTTTKLTGKLARWSVLLQEFDFVVEHRAGTENTNADFLSRYPLTGKGEPAILDWNKGDYNQPPATYLAFMAYATVPLATHMGGAEEIWEDHEVLQLVKTHGYPPGLSSKARDRIYRRGRNYRWMGSSLFRILEGGKMVVVPRP